MKLFKKHEEDYASPERPINPAARFRPPMWLQRANYQILPWLSYALLAALIVTPLLLFGWFLFFTNIFQVQAVTVVDGEPETNEAVKLTIKQHLAKNPLGKNIFFVQTDAMEAEVASQLTQIRTVHIVRKLPGTIKAIVQEKEPALLLQSNGEYYFVDDQGVAYQEASIANLPGVILPNVKNDDSSSAVTLGVAAISPSFVSFVLSIEDLLPKTLNAKVAEIHIPSLAAREVHVILDNNWKILFDVTHQANSQVAVLQKLLASTITQPEKDSLQYIDLRIPNRVYYRSGSE